MKQFSKLKIVNYKIENLKNSFTLVELVIYIGLLSLVILFLFQFVINLVASNVQSKASEALINNSLQVLNIIDSEIRNANALYEPTSVFSDSAGQLSLVISNDEEGISELYSDIFINTDDRVCIKHDLTGVSCVSSPEVEVVSMTFNKIQPSAGTEGAQTILVLQNKANNAKDRILFTLQSSAHVRAY